MSVSRRVAGLAVVLGGVMFAQACRPTVDGAWEGKAECSATGTHPMSALLDEQSDGDIRGHWYIENVDFFGAKLIVRGEVDDGEYDPDHNDYSLNLNTDDDSAAEFGIDFEITDDDADAIEGDIDAFDDGGAVAQTCDLSLDRLSVTSN